MTILITLVYALIKLDMLYERSNPTISGATLVDYTEKINLQEADVQIAFALEGYIDHKNKNDEKYIKMFGRRSVEYHNGTTVESLVETHECTEKDWKKFYPIDEKSKIIFDEINDDEERSFTCVDWSQMDIDIFTQGAGEIKTSKLDFIWVPCNMLYPALGITYETINDSCIDDL